MFSPEHVTGRRLTHDRFARPTIELRSVPFDAASEPFVLVEELEFGGRGVDVGMGSEVRSQPARRALFAPMMRKVGSGPSRVTTSPPKRRPSRDVASLPFEDTDGSMTPASASLATQRGRCRMLFRSAEDLPLDRAAYAVTAHLIIPEHFVLDDVLL